jgi:hypothetical protein
LVFQQALDCCREAPNGAEPCGAGDTQLYGFMKVGDSERDTLPVVPALRASILSVDISKITPARERESCFWEPCCNLLHDTCGVMLAAKNGSPAFIVILQEGRLLVEFEKKNLSKPCFGEFLRYTVVMLV